MLCNVHLAVWAFGRVLLNFLPVLLAVPDFASQRFVPTRPFIPITSFGPDEHAGVTFF